MSPEPTRYTTAAEALAAGDLEALFAINRAKYGGYFMEEGAGGDAGAEGGDGVEGEDGTDEGDDLGADDTEDKRVQRANKQAQTYRNQLRDTQQELAALKTSQQENATVLQALRAALTGESGEETDPAEALAAITGEAESLRSKNAALTAHLLVHELASDNDANPVALLDSRRFADSLAALDASAEDYRTQVANAIKDAVSKNANLRSKAGQGPARGGVDGAGSGSQQPAGAVTQEQFDAMDYKARTDLFRTNPDLYRRLAGN